MLRDNMIYKIVISALVVGSIVMTGIFMMENLKLNQPKQQKFRYHIKCEDGVDVEYIAIAKIPASIVCGEIEK